MKHTLRILSLLALIALLLVGCTDQTPPEAETVYYTVTFDSNGGSAVPSMTVASGKKISAPEEPTRENYIFDGWKNGSDAWDFSYHTVQGDVTLRAAWRSADSVFHYENVEGTDTAILTTLKSEHSTLLVPSTINGFRVVGLGEEIFAGLSSEKVRRILVPETVTRIGDEAFAESAGIEIVLAGALEEIGERAFFGCTGLRSVTLAEGVTSVACEAFAESGLKAVTLPSTLRVIEEGAFQRCAALGTVMLHATIAEGNAPKPIEDSAFRECEALKTVFLYGTEADKTAILAKTASQNAPLAAATFCYYSETEPTQAGSYWYMHDGEPRVW